jgi:signal transduction histidine kinase
LINLLVNAAQAADKENSSVKLDVSMDKTSQNDLVIEVEDNGCGMDEPTQNRLFDPFFTTKPSTEGTGLGLYVSNNLIEALGGRIEVESAPGEGSVFRVILPNVRKK